MKEKLYIIPVKDSLRAHDECPFCYMERNLEQYALDSVLGASCSYMESDVREVTDREGFCRDHYRKMFAYGNALGNSLILETHLRRLKKDLLKEMQHYSENGKSGKLSLMGRFRTGGPSSGAASGATAGAAFGSGSTTVVADSNNNVSRWIRAEECSCHICNIIKSQFQRYLATFFLLYKQNDSEFMELLRDGKGVCIHHLADVLDTAPQYINDKQQKELRELLFAQMETNLDRMIDELEWFQKKFDYRYRDADWNGAQDSVQRAMQKIAGGYPADSPHRGK